LGGGEFAEYAEGEAALLVRQSAAGQNRFNIRQKAVTLLILGNDRGLGGGEATLLDPLDFELDWQAERFQGRANGLCIDTAIQERPEDHIPADAAEAIEVCDAHGQAPGFLCSMV